MSILGATASASSLQTYLVKGCRVDDNIRPSKFVSLTNERRGNFPRPPPTMQNLMDSQRHRSAGIDDREHAPDDRMPMVWADMKFDPQSIDPRGAEREPDDVNFDQQIFGYEQRGRVAASARRAQSRHFFLKQTRATEPVC